MSNSCQDSLSMEFPGENTGVGSHSLLQGSLAVQIKPGSPTLHGDSLPPEPLGKPQSEQRHIQAIWAQNLSRLLCKILIVFHPHSTGQFHFLIYFSVKKHQVIFTNEIWVRKVTPIFFYFFNEMIQIAVQTAYSFIYQILIGWFTLRLPSSLHFQLTHF